MLMLLISLALSLPIIPLTSGQVGSSQLETLNKCEVEFPKIDSTSAGDVGIRVNRPDGFLAEGNTITVPITIKDNMAKPMNFLIQVHGYPYDVPNSPTYAEVYNYTSRDFNGD